MTMHRDARYPRKMSTAEAIARGIRRGAEIAAAPAETRLSATRKVRSTDFTTEAWKSVGKTIQDAMPNGSSRR